MSTDTNPSVKAFLAVADSIISGWRQAFDREDVMPEWRPEPWNLRVNLSLFLRVFSWRYLLTPVGVSLATECWKTPTPGVYTEALIREGYVFGVRVARWVVSHRLVRDPGYALTAKADAEPTQEESEAP